LFIDSSRVKEFGGVNMRNYFYIKRLNISLLIGVVVILTGCGDPILDIEESNAYHWQKNMNEAEFEKLKEGMTYMEVVKIAGGAGEMVKKDEYRWNDEILMTKTYIVRFKDDKLVDKKVSEVKGHKK
jgi:outer membrane protein assembly factor BamE (lipoprotein component of BamABCDE complex)